MEGKKQLGSSSSLTAELFGSKEETPYSSSSTSGIFGSIFAPPSKVLGREYLLSHTKEGENDSVNQPWNPNAEHQVYRKISKGFQVFYFTKKKKGFCSQTDDAAYYRQKESQEMKNKDMSSIYQEQRAQPCHLSSSIFYGGQDDYVRPQNSHNSLANSVFKKDGGEDDSGSASRGNWWQGSLYY